MDQLIDLKTGQLQIIIPVSNSYQNRTHANATLLKHELLANDWRWQPDDLTQNFLEIWIPAGAHAIEIALTPPGQASPA